MSPRSSHRSGEQDEKRRAVTEFSDLSATETTAAGGAAIRRVGPVEAERIIARLTPYETNLVHHLDTVRIVTRTQLGRLQPGNGTPLAEARRLQRTLAHLCEQRVVARIDRGIGGRTGGSEGPLYALDVVGRRLAGIENDRRLRRPTLPGDRFLAHTLAITEVFVVLVEGARTKRFELLEFEGEPDCWRPMTDRHGGRALLKPDAFLRLGDGDYEHSAFVEVDLATESLPTIIGKAKVYGRYYDQGTEQQKHGVFPAVQWLTPTERRRAALVNALGRLPADHWRLHRVARLDDVPDALLGS